MHPIRGFENEVPYTSMYRIWVNIFSSQYFFCPARARQNTTAEKKIPFVLYCATLQIFLMGMG